MNNSIAIRNERVSRQPLFQNNIHLSDLFWLFMLGSVFGFVLEGIWCIIKNGAWESHSATVWGPFCVIYGIGAAAVYLVSMLLKKKNPFLQFAVFSVIGSCVEYFGSLFQELCFRSASWDYSDMFMNIGGRVSFVMTLVWGVIGFAFMRLVTPLLNRIFEKMRGHVWRMLCVVLTVFMAVNLLVTSAAVTRWRGRIDDKPASNLIEQFLDNTYGNESMEKLFPNMVFMD